VITDDFTSGDIKKQLMTMAIPVSVGLFFNTMFNVVDTFYAGRLSTSSLAGMSLSFSIFFILIAIVSGISTGLSALLSIAYGKKDHELVRSLTSNGILLTFIISMVLTVVGYVFSPVLLRLLGAENETLIEGSRYVRGIYAGTLFFGINSAMNALLSSRGVTKPYRNFLIIGFVLNLILDPLFIYGPFGLPRLGTLGVALATVVVQIIGSIYLGYKCIKILKLDFSIFEKKSYKIEIQSEILSQGIPASLNLMTIAIGIFLINYFIYRHGNDASIAGYGAAMRIEQIALLPALGLNTAAMTIAGQNFGAGQYDRVRKTYVEAIKVGMIIMTFGMILVYPLAPFLVGIFNKEHDVIFEGTRYLRIDFLAFNAYIILNVCLSILQAIKKPRYAIGLGIYRQLLMPFVLFTLLGSVLGLGLVGIWIGIVATTWSAAILTLFITRYELSKIIDQR
jgi:putative MATE family efflux protein